MATKIDSRQTEHRSNLPQISTEAKPTLKQVLPAIDLELTPPFVLRPSNPVDLQISVGSSKITNPQTNKERISTPLNGSFIEFTSGTVTFPSSSGGTITVSAGVNGTLTVTSNNYIKVLIQVDNSGDLFVKSGTEGASVTLATIPEQDSDKKPIGYITLFNNAGTINNLDYDAISQLSEPMGSSLRMKEQDGSPDLTGIHTIQVENNTLTDLGNGSVAYSPSGASVIGVEKLILTAAGTVVYDTNGDPITKA